jgi:L-fucose dehydrogenase
MELSLRDKVVAVTGGAKGIGEAVVRGCAQEGALPVIVDRDDRAVRELQNSLLQIGVKSEAVIVDLMDTANSSSAVQAVATQLGHIEALVNNAGTNDGVGLDRGSPELFVASLQKNLVHYFTITQALLPALKASKGSIVNIGSKIAMTGQGGTSGYAAAKGAILELTTAWAEELAPYGVRVNTVVPAEVATPQYMSWLSRFENPQGELSKISARVPLGHRLTHPSEIAAMVVFLLSSRCSVNGQNICVDGGYVHLDRAVR